MPVALASWLLRVVLAIRGADCSVVMVVGLMLAELLDTVSATLHDAASAVGAPAAVVGAGGAVTAVPDMFASAAV